MIEDARSAASSAGQHHRGADFGNTGVGLALVAAVKGYKLILVMPESFSVERRKLMAAYGATFELTPRELGMKGAIAKAREIVAETPGAWLPMQFDNRQTSRFSRRTTAEEIARDFPEGLDYIFAGVGTGGHVTALARYCGALAQAQVFAVEPELSPVLSGGNPGPHPIQGIGADSFRQLSRRRRQRRRPGGSSRRVQLCCPGGPRGSLLVGVSSGAVARGGRQKAARDQGRARILAFTYDSGSGISPSGALRTWSRRPARSPESRPHHVPLERPPSWAAALCLPNLCSIRSQSRISPFSAE